MSLSHSLANVGRAVAYYPTLSKFFGSINASIFFTQLHYWQSRTSDERGVHKTSDQWTEETGLSYREQATARQHLVKQGFLIETPERLKHRIYFRLDLLALDASFEAWTKAQFANDENAIGEMRKAQSAEDVLRSSPSAANAVGGLTKTHSVNKEKITTEITAESSSSGTAGAAPAAGKRVDGGAKKDTKKPAKKRAKKIPAPAASAPTDGAMDAAEVALQEACRATWAAYSLAYEQRYKVKPVRNAPVNANVKALVKRLGYEEAPQVAEWYVANVHEPFVVNNSHGVGVLVNQAEGYRTQWARAMSGAAQLEQPAPVETYAQRAARQRVEEVTPLAARKVPGAPNPIERLSALMQSGLVKIGTEVGPVAAEGDEHAPR